MSVKRPQNEALVALALPRLREVLALRTQGRTYRAIGGLYGITPQRAQQLYLRACDLLGVGK